MIDKSPVRFKHSTNVGDAIASLCAVQKYYQLTGEKIIYCQKVNHPAHYYDGATHPIVDEQNKFVSCNRKMFDMVKPLLLSQEYIHDVEEYEGQDCYLDFDVIRGDELFVNLPHGSIQSWLMYAFPDLANDISKPWMKLDGECPDNIRHQVEGKIILNFTERYRNYKINYYFLKKYENHLIFSGTNREYMLFCNTWKLNIPILNIENFLELGYALKTSKFLLCNQSSAWNLATALGTPRVLEVCRYAQNCLPFYGEHNYGYFHQKGVEYYFYNVLF